MYYMKQTLLRIKLPEGEVLYPSQLRSITAALNKPARALFARDEAGQAVVYPGVRFVGGKSWVGILADEAHQELLMVHAGLVMMAVGKAVKGPCGFEVEDLECSLQAVHYPIAYRAQRIAIKKRHLHTADVTELLTQRIYQSIDRTCARFGMDCPDMEDMGIIGVHVEREIGMRLETDQGPTQQFVALIDATFSLHANLKGMWFVGNLTSRGHGRIVKHFGLLGGGIAQ